MKTYLVLAYGSTNEQDDASANTIDQWDAWSKIHAEHIVDMGAPLSAGVEGSGSDGFKKLTVDQ